MNNLANRQNLVKKENRPILCLILSLLVITLVYQLRPFLDDSQFAWISASSNSTLLGILFALSSTITIKLYKKKHFQSKAFLLFTIGVACWFIAEQLWDINDYIFNVEPFPSEADIFYLSSYPFFVSFLLISLKPIRKLITKKIWLFSITLSFSLLIPSIIAYLDSPESSELDLFAKSLALAYPILSSFQLVPAIIGLLFLIKKEVSYSWMLLLFGFLIYSAADSFFLFSNLDGSYYDGHPADLMYLYGFLLLIFSLQNRLKLVKNSNDENQEIFFNEKIKFETIIKFGIPLVLIIFSMIVIISLFSVFYFNSEQGISLENIIFGIIAMLGVFSVIIITINKNIKQFVKIRTKELEEQRQNLESIIEEKTQALLKAERLSAIGELSGRVAHDLKNPLSVMKMSVELIKTSSDAKISDSVITKRLELIEKSIDRISHQVDDVLGFVRVTSLKMGEASLKKIIMDSIAKTKAPQNITITVADSDVVLNCDSAKISTVFLNLMINAIQAMPEGGSIEIKIKTDDDDIVIDIVDSGVGIPEEFTDKIFDPLFTTKQRGTGLGLASCKNIIEQHNGKISVKNNPTTFTIRLPKISAKIYQKQT